MVLLEAMATGAPIVATDIPGYRSVFTHEEEGVAVPPRDPRALAAAIRRVLMEPGLSARLGARGVETARAYGWDQVVDRLESVYLALGGERSRDTRVPDPRREASSARALSTAAP
jgi:phosphatidylinositol alpha-mannosyltransferase